MREWGEREEEESWGVGGREREGEGVIEKERGRSWTPPFGNRFMFDVLPQHEGNAFGKVLAAVLKKDTYSWPVCYKTSAVI